MRKFANFLVKKLRRAWRWIRKRVVKYPKLLWELGFLRRHFLVRLRDLGEIPSLNTISLPAAPRIALRATHFNGNAHEDTTISSRQLHIRRVENVIFEPHQEWLAREGKLYLQTLGLSKGASDPKEGHSLHSEILKWNNKRYSLLDKSAVANAVDLPKGVLLNGSFPQNWYHWVVCILPKAFAFTKYSQGQFDAPLLVSEAVKNTPMENLLRFLVPEAEIEYLPNTPHRVNHAVVVDSPVREVAYTRKRGGSIDWTSMGSFHASLMKEYRDELLSIAHESRDNTSLAPERVYLSRRGVTRPFNESEVWDSLRALGFTKVFLEDLTPIQQINLFANGKYFVSITGAQWAGIMFATGAKGLIIAPRFLMPSMLFQKLAHLGDSNISGLELQTADRNWNEHFGSHSLSHVSQKELVKSVKQMLV